MGRWRRRRNSGNQNSGLRAYRITNIRERGGPTRTASQPTWIALPARLDETADDCFFPEMVQVRYRGEWYLIRREQLKLTGE
ncbi:MAG TPA: hypothetical protein VHB50_18080 [Bryobacteraceae bacterium]|nr:hypothetical protein [Bryobacteraceae bacterium]